MRQKLGTAINPRLLYRAKLLASQEQKHLNEIIEEALEQYLSEKRIKTKGCLSPVVKSSKGCIPASADLVRKVPLGQRLHPRPAAGRPALRVVCQAHN
ncbi:MAG TPA: hypothetical protein GXX19_11365 [Syntrophomonadaceae bacterium]|nr:hypothetical protein [Syntrophomonadaceae bacterium]